MCIKQSVFKKILMFIVICLSISCENNYGGGDPNSVMNGGNNTPLSPIDGSLHNNNSAGTSASALVTQFNGIGETLNQALVDYCGRCAMSSSLCDEGAFFDNTITIEDADCIIAQGTTANLQMVTTLLACQSSAALQAKTCIEQIMACSDQEIFTCLDDYDSAMCEPSDDSFFEQVGVACFGEAPSFTCANGVEIQEEWVCDYYDDCGDNSDEPADCPPPFLCEDGEELPMSWVCDNSEDCINGEDEQNCMMFME